MATHNMFNYDADNLEGEKLFYLPHQCDEWIIGDITAMERFIKEAQELLDRVKGV